VNRETEGAPVFTASTLRRALFAWISLGAIVGLFLGGEGVYLAAVIVPLPFAESWARRGARSTRRLVVLGILTSLISASGLALGHLQWVYASALWQGADPGAAVGAVLLEIDVAVRALIQSEEGAPILVGMGCLAIPFGFTLVARLERATDGDVEKARSARAAGATVLILACVFGESAVVAIASHRPTSGAPAIASAIVLIPIFVAAFCAPGCIGLLLVSAAADTADRAVTNRLARSLTSR
jgi:hypothetical protein